MSCIGSEPDRSCDGLSTLLVAVFSFREDNFCEEFLVTVLEIGASAIAVVLDSLFEDLA